MIAAKTIFFTIFTGILLANGSALEVTSADLIENANIYDGKEIVYSGEVVGDIMERGQNAWINVSDGDNAVGVWVSFEETYKIKYTGNYKTKGDTIEIEGVFNRACPEHGGDLDIHAAEIEVLNKGYNIQKNVGLLSIISGGCLFLVAIVLTAAVYKKRL